MAVQRQMPSAQSVEQIRARARRRLIGAFVLVVLAIALFAWLFDSTPRQNNVDIPIEVAGQRSNVDSTALADPLPQTPQQGGVVIQAGTEPGNQLPDALPGNEPAGGVNTTDPVLTDIATAGVQGPVIDTQDPGATGTAPVDTEPQEGVSVYSYGVRPANLAYLKSKYPPNMASQVASTSNIQRPALSDNERRAAELLGDLPPVSAGNASGGRTAGETGQKFVVQVGAYADQGKVDEVRAKLSLSGYSSFVQDVQTDAGKRMRVRVGPFNGRYAADSAAEKIKGLGLQVSVLPM